jgi:hypothetical protein
MKPSAVRQIVLRVIVLVVGDKREPSSTKARPMSKTKQKNACDIPSKKLRIVLFVAPGLALIVGLVRYFVRIEDAVINNTDTIDKVQKVIDGRLDNIEGDVNGKHGELDGDVDELSAELRSSTQKLARLEAQGVIYEWKITQVEQLCIQLQDQIAQLEARADDRKVAAVERQLGGVERGKQQSVERNLGGTEE